VWAGNHLLLPVNNRYSPPAQWVNAMNRVPTENGITIGFRTEDVLLKDDGPMTGTVIDAGLHGSYTMLAIDLGDGQTIIEARISRDASVTEGDQVRFDVKPAMVRFFDSKTEKAIQPA
jgi:ABC-type sugar transport system ATPase subunit